MHTEARHSPELHTTELTLEPMTHMRLLTEEGVAADIAAGLAWLRSGAPHSFFDRSFSEYQEAARDAWRRVLAFIERDS